MSELKDRIKTDFAYHKPSSSEVAERHEKTRNILFTTANALIACVPAGREQALMLTKLEEAMFWANAGIARESTKV